MDTEELAHLTELRKIYVKKLRVLEQQEANFGNYSPPHIITEIKDIRIKIEELDYKTRIIMNSTFQYIVQSQERMESKSTQGNALKIQDAPKFEVILTDVGSTRMRVVKAICETVNLELHEARELTFDANSLILDTVSKEEAERIKRRLEEAGAKVEINPQRLKHLTIEQLRTKSLFTVVLRESGFNKSAITRTICDITGMNPENAALLCGKSDFPVLVGVNRKIAEEAKEKLERYSAIIDIV